MMFNTIAVDDLRDDYLDYDLSEYGELSRDIDLWIDRLMTGRKLSKKTERSYHEALKPFSSFCASVGDRMQINEIGPKFINIYIEHYIVFLADRDLERGKIDESEYTKIRKMVDSKQHGGFGTHNADLPIPRRYLNTLKHRIVVLKKLLRYISENNKQRHDYTHFFGMIAKPKEREDIDRTVLSEEELDRLIETALLWPQIHNRQSDGSRSRAFTAWRNSLLFLLFAETGMRSFEGLSLKLEDIELKTSEKTGIEYCRIKVRGGKGDKDRVVIATSDIAGHLRKMEEYFGSDRSRRIASRTANDDMPISYTSLYKYARRIYEAAELEASGFHVLRRSWATINIREGKQQALVAKQLGHSSFSTTYKHYLVATEEDLAEEFLG